MSCSFFMNNEMMSKPRLPTLRAIGFTCLPNHDTYYVPVLMYLVARVRVSYFVAPVASDGVSKVSFLSRIISTSIVKKGTLLFFGAVIILLDEKKV